MGLGASISRLLGLNGGELRRVAPIAAAYALTLATIYVLKPARNALFLDNVGVDSLPYALILVALVGGFTVSLYARLAAGLRLDRLVRLPLLVMVLLLLGSRPLLERGDDWVYFAFFVLVQVYGLLATSLVWLWANAVFDARQARRVFGLIGTGGIIGAIGGGLLTGLITQRVGTLNLPVVAAFMTVAIGACLRLAPVGRAASSDQTDEGSTDETDATALPRLLALNSAVIAFVAVFVDVQFNDIVDRAFESSEGKAAFFGTFFATVSLFSLGFQVFATPWILGRVGVGLALSILPAALALGSGLVLLGPIFPLATLPKVADGGFRHSIHKSASELLFIPVPEHLKRRTKLFIDTTVDTAATGLGALTVLFMTGPLGLSYQQLTLGTVLLVVVSLFVVRALRRAYVAAFRRAIEGRRIDVSSLTVGLGEAGAIDLLLPALRSNHPRQVLYALDLLSSTKSAGVASAVEPLLDHNDPEIRRRAVQVLQANRVPLDDDARRRLLADASAAVRTAVLIHTTQANPDEARTDIERMLEAEDLTATIAALDALRAMPRADQQAVLSERRLDRLWARRGSFPELSAPLAGAIASALEQRLYRRLEALLEHAPQPVLAAAIQGLGESADPAFIPWLVGRLADRRTRAAARRALSAYGVSALAPLLAVMDARSQTLLARRAAVRAIAGIDDDEAARALAERLPVGDPVLAHEVVAALKRLRRAFPHLRFPKRPIVRALRDRLAARRLILACSENLPPPRCDATRLFHRAMEEKAEREEAEVFDLLALLHDPDSLRDAFRRIRSGTDSDRADALEYLANVLEPSLAQVVVPFFEIDEPSEVLESTATGFEELPESPAELMRAWSHVRDPWIRACALYAAPTIAPEIARPSLWSGAHEPHPLVDELIDARTDRAPPPVSRT